MIAVCFACQVSVASVASKHIFILVQYV